ILLAYLVILVAIGVWGGRGSGDVAGYYVAGRQLPSWVIAFSSNATGESAWLLLGLTGMGYLVGIHALWVVLGEVLGVTLSWVLVARPFKEYTTRFDSITVPDFLEDRLHDSRHLIRIVSAVIIFTMVTPYTAAQLMASGKAFQSFLGLNYTTGLLIGAAVIFFYTTIGGFKAVAYSDVLQGGLMLLSLIALPAVGIAAAGGWGRLMGELRSVEPSLLLPFGKYGFSPAGIASAVSFVGIGLAFLGAPQLLARFISARDHDEIVSGSLLAVICIIIFDMGAVFTGIAGRALFPDLADPETVMPTLSVELFPTVFTGLFLAVVLAAMMSTVDSLLLLASSAVVRDVVQKIYLPSLPQRRLSLYGKLTTLVIGVGALVFAWVEVRMIFWFVLFAWSGLGAAFGPPVLCSLFWRRTTLPGALCGMVGGFLTTVLWALFFREQFYNLYEMVPGFILGLVLTIVVSRFTEPAEGVEAQFASVKQAVGHPFKGQSA
ncbi:sodium/proline symporter, partial [Acidobacteria bacterium AH-259-O06]|nr:sodium/proline symporter [Acidobacteria bacterium AH-259-O06]